MIIRFEVRTPDFTPAADPTICGVSTSVIAAGNIQVDAYIYESRTSLVDISPTGTIYTINIAQGTYLWDYITVRLTISGTGFRTYTNTFRLYREDYGNDIGGGITENVDFTLYLIQEYYDNTPAGGDAQTRLAYSKFIAFRTPMSGQVNVYNASSSEGAVSYFTGDSYEDLIGNTQNTSYCCDGDIQIQQHITILEKQACCAGYITIDECDSTQEILQINFIPDWWVSILCNNCGDGECTDVLAINTVRTDINVSDIPCYFHDDVREPYYDSITIKNTLYAPGNTTDDTGNILGYIQEINEYDVALQDNAAAGCNVETVTPLDLPRLFNFNAVKEGDYVVVTEVIVKDSNQADGYIMKCTKSSAITSCFWYKVEEVDTCGKYKVWNKSTENKDFKIYELTDIDTFTLIHEETIPPCTSVLVQVNNDGVYKFDLEYTTETTYTYIVISYCNLDECRRQYLHNIMCCDPKNKCRPQDVYNLLSLAAQVEAYFSMINYEYNFNYRYEALNSQKIDELYTLKQFMDRFVEYCDECNIPPDCGTNIVGLNNPDCN